MTDTAAPKKPAARKPAVKKTTPDHTQGVAAPTAPVATGRIA